VTRRCVAKQDCDSSRIVRCAENQTVYIDVTCCRCVSGRSSPIRRCESPGKGQGRPHVRDRQMAFSMLRTRSDVDTPTVDGINGKTKAAIQTVVACPAQLVGRLAIMCHAPQRTCELPVGSLSVSGPAGHLVSPVPSRCPPPLPLRLFPSADLPLRAGPRARRSPAFRLRRSSVAAFAGPGPQHQPVGNSTTHSFGLPCAVFRPHGSPIARLRARVFTAR
jgi:hypothetical protein